MKDSTKKYIQTAFVLLVFVMVCLQLKKIVDTANTEDIRGLFYSLAPSHLALIALICFTALLPTMANDVILNRLLGNELDRKYLLGSSYMINSLNMTLGFGGLIGAGLRTYFYGHKSHEKEIVMISLGQYMIYLVVMGIFIILSIIYTFLHPNPLLNRYRFILWIGLFVSVGVIFVYRGNFLKGRIQFAVPGKKNQQIIAIASTIEWLLQILSFILIGRLMGHKYSLATGFVLTLMGQMIGLASMIPSGLGSFDLFITKTFGVLGVSVEGSLSWLLLYRIFYNFVPFFIALILLLRYWGVDFIRSKREKKSIS